MGARGSTAERQTDNLKVQGSIPCAPTVLEKKVEVRIKLRTRSMKKQNIRILVIALIFILGVFGFWQFNLYQKFSKETLSCGGDWSYNVRCPIGSYCQSLGQGPLAGGLCKPFLSTLFNVFSKSENEKSSQNFPSPKPLKESPSSYVAKKIISSEITVEGCKIKVTTTKGEFFLNTSFGPQTKCYQFVQNQVSSSGKYVVFQDLSGGIDSMLRVYSIEYNDTIQLDVFGTSSIFYFSFLPDDKLVTLYGYKGIYKEQYLKVFDISGLFGSYPSNIDKQYKYFTNLNQYSKNITLPDIGKDYFDFSIADRKIKIYGTQGMGSEVLKEYTFDELSK